MRPPTAIRPASGVASPAIESSKVVFPAPDAPNRMVTPLCRTKATSSSKLPEALTSLRLTLMSADSVDGTTRSPDACSVSVNVVFNDFLFPLNGPLSGRGRPLLDNHICESAKNLIVEHHDRICGSATNKSATKRILEARASPPAHSLNPRPYAPESPVQRIHQREQNERDHDQH